MKIIKIGEDFYCIAPNNIDFNTYLERFLKLSKVRENSFVEKYLKKIYNCVFTGYVDMKEMYTWRYEFYKENNFGLYYSELCDIDKKIFRKMGEEQGNLGSICQKEIINANYKKYSEV